MKITRINPLNGNKQVRDLDITQEEYDAWRKGKLIQFACPRLKAWEREYMITGHTQETWDEMFKNFDK